MEQIAELDQLPRVTVKIETEIDSGGRKRNQPKLR